MENCSLNEFGDRMVELLPKLMTEITRYENNYVTMGKITIVQMAILDCLSQHDLCKMNKLAEFMNISFSTATGLVDRLVKQDLVKRMRGEDDRRTVLVEITPRGKKILEEIYDQKRKGIVQIFRPLSGQERKIYLEILNKLVDNLSHAKCKGAC